MERVQLALNVSNVDEAVDFYAKLFKTPVTKRRPGYANFAIDSPPMKLVLIENAKAAGTVNHLGVEVGTADQVATETERLTQAGIAEAVEQNSTCCYAVQNKVWASAPDGERWEIYAVLSDAPSELPMAAGCCTDQSAHDTVNVG